MSKCLASFFAALFSAILFACLASSVALAMDPDEQLADPALEARARVISAGLRCLVCQNQSIDDSDASLAKDLRLLVRQQLRKGASDREVIDYVVARYGEFVLLEPKLSAKTVLLWGAPLVLLFSGVLLAIYALRKRASDENAPLPLSEEEQKALSALLSNKRGTTH